MPCSSSMAIQALLSRARGDVAIGAVLGFARAHGVRHEGAERLAAEAFGGNGLLRVVEPLAIRILRADQNGAGRARRRDAMAGDGAVHGEHVAVVAQHLEIVGGPVARREAFVVQHGPLRVGASSPGGSRNNWASTRCGRRSRSCCCWRARAAIRRSGTSPQVPPSVRSVLARRDFSL